MRTDVLFARVIVIGNLLQDSCTKCWKNTRANMLLACHVSKFEKCVGRIAEQGAKEFYDNSPYSGAVSTVRSYMQDRMVFHM